MNAGTRGDHKTYPMKRLADDETRRHDAAGRRTWHESSTYDASSCYLEDACFT